MKYSISEIQDIIENRRSIKPKDYSDRKVPKEIIDKLLDAAKWAPTHGLTQPWYFVVFQDDSTKELATFLSNLYKSSTSEDQFLENKYQKILKRGEFCNAVIAIGMRRQETEKIPEIEEVQAVACAVQNISLLATAYGLSCFWSTGKLTYLKQTKEFLGLKSKDQCLGFLYVGYPAIAWPKGQRKPREYFSHYHH